jgi:4,5-dihydroxyphthalate decarboxylase
MSQTLRLSIATIDYDHVRDFRLGTVKAVGIEPIWLMMGLHEIFARFIASREWDVSEISFAKFVSLATEPDPDLIALPVFLSRSFRFGSIYLNRNAGIAAPEDLRGKRIGVPEWAQTAAVYSRGWLQHDAGVPLESIDWVQAGIDEAGRLEKIEPNLPRGLSLTPMPEKTLAGMLAAGEIDAALCAAPPKNFGRDPNIVRLFPDYREMDRAYFRRTGVFPIMHVVAIKRAILDENPWVARNLYKAFEAAKRSAERRLRHGHNYPVPWLAEHVEDIEEIFGADCFPYGIEPNRPTLALFLRYAYEQGIAHRLVEPEEIFPEGMMVEVRV